MDHPLILAQQHYCPLCTQSTALHLLLSYTAPSGTCQWHLPQQLLYSFPAVPLQMPCSSPTAPRQRLRGLAGYDNLPPSPCRSLAAYSELFSMYSASSTITIYLTQSPNCEAIWHVASGLVAFAVLNGCLLVPVCKQWGGAPTKVCNEG